MQVILLERIGRLGAMGETVTVKPGYARNYLLPQKKALRATTANLAYFEAQKAHLQAENAERKAAASTLAKKVEGLKVVIIRQAGESGHLYGSVSARDIADAVTAAGYKVSRDMVAMHHPIKTIGLFDEVLHLHPEVEVKIKLNVARSAEEAKVQDEKGAAVIASTSLTAEAEAAEEALKAAEAAALAALTETSPAPAEETVSYKEARGAARKSKGRRTKESSEDDED